MIGMSEEFDTHLQELRRGTVVLACLELLQSAGYGYGLLEQLGALGFTADANTLYPLLRRLEKQGYLTSEWNTEEARPRKFYRTSPDGLRLAEALIREWRALDRAMDSLAAADPAAPSPSGHERPGSPDTLED
ncbi:Transcriptional regulator, PadR family [Gulosibacter sp. 10]|nr:Transcriptional regulator, PadR family [Gulosibacter sp. 10]